MITKVSFSLTFKEVLICVFISNFHRMSLFFFFLFELKSLLLWVTRKVKNFEALQNSQVKKNEYSFIACNSQV